MGDNCSKFGPKRTKTKKCDMDTKSPIVATYYGKVQGTISHVIDKSDPIYVFYGIPFAAPPVGEKRFAPPEIPAAWNGVRDATKARSVCPQDMENTAVCFSPVPPLELTTDEDCLHLNIYTSNLDPHAHKPVMFYVHGGSFNKGAPEYYDGTAYVAYGDVVVVSVTYRLGALGYLTTEDDTCLGNNGFLDQVAALRWVQENITNFGGDPKNVTIFGESAGAISVQILTMSPLTEGLFHKVISQSAGCVMPNVIPKNGPYRAFQLGKLLGCETKDSKVLIKFLRTIPIDKLIEAQNQLVAQGLSPTVTVDGNFLKEHPAKLYNEGRFQKIPHLVGLNSDEGYYFAHKLCAAFNDDSFTVAQALEFLKLFFSMSYPGKENVVVDAMKEIYFTPKEVEKMVDNCGYLRTVCGWALGEMFLGGPSWRIGQLHCEYAPTYVYVYTHKPSFSRYPGTPSGATHEEELVLAWGDPFIVNRPISNIQTYTEDEKELSVKMIKYWTNFAKNGHPNGDGLPNWPQFDQNKAQYMELNTEQCQVKEHFKQIEMEFWNQKMAKLTDIDR